jgi:uncharacterized protein YfaP (DUF2135 family)
MKKSRLLCATVILSQVFILTCSQQSNVNAPPDDGTISQQERWQIMASISSFKLSADAALLAGDSAALASLIPGITADTIVDSAWMTGNALHVSYKRGGIVSWEIATDATIPPWLTANALSKRVAAAATGLNLVGNKKACLINQQATDEGRTYCADIINNLSSEFANNHFTASTFNGAGADINFFGSRLGGFGAIFDISHGCFDGTNTWLMTGERGILDTLVTKYATEWKAHKIDIGAVKERNGGHDVVVSYYQVSNLFFDAQYGTGDFPHSLVYLVACQSFKDAELLLPKVLNAKGAAAVVGWDETNCLGQSTGKTLFDAMLGGARLDSAIAHLPAEAKSDNCPVTAHLASRAANLTYYPSSGGSLRLVDTLSTAIVVITPADGGASSTRNVTLQGYLSGAARIRYGTVELNGVATTLTVVNDTGFEQPLVLGNGDNSIVVDCYGVKSDGSLTFTSKSIFVRGAFDTLALWTELRWNTNLSDVDFHLLPPGAGVDKLWTTTDCYYSNKEPSWGGYLDVDDVDGYGPEHITIPALTVEGTYALYVHYYSDHDVGASDAYVTVSSKNGSNVNFGPYRLVNSAGNNAGDLYEVCTIDFPSGRITPVNQYIFLGAAKRLANMPKKTASAK